MAYSIILYNYFRENGGTESGSVVDPSVAFLDLFFIN